MPSSRVPRSTRGSRRHSDEDLHRRSDGHRAPAARPVTSFKNLDAALALTNRLGIEGTDHLLTGWPNAREGGRVKTEEDPLDPHPAPTMVQTLEAIRTLEATVLGASDLAGVRMVTQQRGSS